PDSQVDFATIEGFKAEVQVQAPGRAVARVHGEGDLRRASCASFLQRFASQFPADATATRFRNHADIRKIPALRLRNLGKEKHSNRFVRLQSEPPLFRV